MNIPDEVQKKADDLYWDRDKSHGGLGCAEEAYEYIAEWARKEALREAREMIERQAPDMGPRILITEYREGLYDGVSRSARAVGRLLGASS